MPDEPRKIFDLMDTETEPTDEQLEELMRYVGESIRAKKRAAGLPVREPGGKTYRLPVNDWAKPILNAISPQ